MQRAGIGNQLRLVAACEDIARPRVGVKKDLSTVGRNLVNNLVNGKAKALSLEQIDVLCQALKCTPNQFFGWEELSEVTAARELEELKRDTLQIKDILLKLSKDGTPLGEEIRKAFSTR